MDINKFNDLSLSSKLQYTIDKGKYISTKVSENKKVIKYSINDFYVIIEYSPVEYGIIDISAIKEDKTNVE
jgi:hypothetical protein